MNTERRSTSRPATTTGTPPGRVETASTTAGNDREAIFACEGHPRCGQQRRRRCVAQPGRQAASTGCAKLQGFDAWTTACVGLPTACPPRRRSPDFDFGQGAVLIPTRRATSSPPVRSPGSCGGLNAQNRFHCVSRWSVRGRRKASNGAPPRTASASTSPLANFNFPHSVLSDGPTRPTGTPATSSAGSWGASTPVTGQILWQTADPNGSIDLGADERRERRRLRRLDGPAPSSARRPGADDVRPRRGKRGPVVVRERRIP